MTTIAAIIRDSGLTLSEIHRHSGISRTTLSRVTNGRQAMSRKTAKKLASVLGVSAEKLVQTSSTQPAAPEILRVSALELSQWGKSRRAEHELPELVGRLIRSELFAAGSIRAPSGNRIIEPGPDIAVDAPRKTRHIPHGPSVWEVSTNSDFRNKAKKDLERHRVPPGWRPEDTSFVFVTTQSWQGGNEWAFQQHSKHPWRSVIVLDATDLQGWIEEAPGVQIWLMDRMESYREGFQSLPQAVQEWGSVADPPLHPSLFTGSVERHFSDWHHWIQSTGETPLSIAGESRGEVLLFIQSLIDRTRSNHPFVPIEGVCVSTEDGIHLLAASPPSDVVVIPMNEEVRNVAIGHCGRLRVVLPTTGQPRVADPIVVSSAGREQVRKFLLQGGYDAGRASQLARSSGGSVSVLRRLIHKDRNVAPDFELNKRYSQILAAAGLFGIWDAGSAADRRVVLRLTGQRRDEKLEEAWTEILNLPETPVWMDGERRGVNSRLDTWQRFTERKITPQAVDRYFDAVSLALGQAPLERPGDRILLPNDYQSLRDSQVSGELLRGLAQGLVLLAEFGDRIDPRRVGPPVSDRVQQVAFDALKDITVERLRALHVVMPLLAEAAPEAFIEAMEADLDRSDSAQRALLNFSLLDSEGKSTHQFLGGTSALVYRSSLMRAYETLGWFPEHAEPAIELLARLADEEISDHHGGQPRQSLVELLKPWHRGSMLDSERHCAVLRKLVANHPKWAFEFACKCLPTDHDIADGTNLPLWRGRVDGADSVLPDKHRLAVYRTAADVVVQYAGTSETTIFAAIDAVHRLAEKEAVGVWEEVAVWASSGNCNDEFRTRLVRYLTALADGALFRDCREYNRKGARGVLKELSSFQAAAPDLWVFDDDATTREHRPEDSGWQETEERLERKRRSTIQHVRESGGIGAILALVGEVRNTLRLGRVASQVLSTADIRNVARDAFQEGGDAARSPMRWFIQGLLDGIDDSEVDSLAELIAATRFAEQTPHWLPCLIARLPLELGADRADGLSGEALNHYWQQFDAGWRAIPRRRKDWLITGLCSVGRPRAALLALRGAFEGARTESLQLLLHALPQSNEERLDQWAEEELVSSIQKRPDLSPVDAARIEFMFFDAYKRQGMPALAKLVASDPSWFKEALMLCTQRRDHAKDPPDWEERREKAPEWLRFRAYRLFEWLPRLPGTTSSGYDVEQGLAWTEAILAFAEEQNRREVAETLLGHAFGSGGFHEDGSPRDELSALLGRLQCSRIEEGVAITVGNKLGAVRLPADDAGRPYRDRAAFYAQLEKRHRDSAPRTARVMRLIKRHFEDQGRRTDDRRRLDEHLDAHS